MPLPRIDVVLLKTRTCPLCDKALHVLKREERRLGLHVIVKDLSDDPENLALYGLEIPVVFVDGKKRFFGAVEPVLLAREVQAARERLRRTSRRRDDP